MPPKPATDEENKQFSGKILTSLQEMVERLGAQDVRQALARQDGGDQARRALAEEIADAAENIEFQQLLADQVKSAQEAVALIKKARKMVRDAVGSLSQEDSEALAGKARVPERQPGESPAKGKQRINEGGGLSAAGRKLDISGGGNAKSDSAGKSDDGESPDISEEEARAMSIRLGRAVGELRPGRNANAWRRVMGSPELSAWLSALLQVARGQDGRPALDTRGKGVLLHTLLSWCTEIRGALPTVPSTVVYPTDVKITDMVLSAFNEYIAAGLEAQEFGKLGAKEGKHLDLVTRLSKIADLSGAKSTEKQEKAVDTDALVKQITAEVAKAASGGGGGKGGGRGGGGGRGSGWRGGHHGQQNWQHGSAPFYGEHGPPPPAYGAGYQQPYQGGRGRGGGY